MLAKDGKINQWRLGDKLFGEVSRGLIINTISWYTCLSERHIAQSCISYHYEKCITLVELSYLSEISQTNLRCTIYYWVIWKVKTLNGAHSKTWHYSRSILLFESYDPTDVIELSSLVDKVSCDISQ